MPSGSEVQELNSYGHILIETKIVKAGPVRQAGSLAGELLRYHGDFEGDANGCQGAGRVLDR